MPSPYRSAMRRPLHVTTKAAVIPAAGSKAASTACLTLTASSSVITTAEHMIFAKPDVRGSRRSPGGGTYGVLSSSDLARAIRASRLETVAWGGGAPVFTAGVSAWYPRAAAQAVSASAVTIMRILICYLLLRGAGPAFPLHDKGG